VKLRTFQSQTPLGKETTNSEKMFQAGFTPIPPRDESRLEYAMHLRAYALHFLIGHEIAHITLGHVDYLNSINAAALIEELGWVETDQIEYSKDNALRRTLTCGPHSPAFSLFEKRAPSSKQQFHIGEIRRGVWGV